MLFFCRRGYLPWMDAEEIPGLDKKERMAAILDIKRETTMHDLTLGLPECFEKYMKYCRNLQFDQKPNYAYLQGLFDQTIIKMEYTIDHEFCWHYKKQEIISEKIKENVKSL